MGGRRPARPEGSVDKHDDLKREAIGYARAEGGRGPPGRVRVYH